MKQLDLGKSGLMVSEIALGCMRMSDLSNSEEASKVIETSVSEGMTFFDHAIFMVAELLKKFLRQL